MAVGLPFFFLSRFAWPVEANPARLNLIAQIIPPTPAIDGLVRFSQMGASLSDIQHRLWHLWALVGFFACVVLWL